MPNIVHWFGAFLLLAATALLIVTSVSSPIWDHVGFLKGNLGGQSFTAGTWGVCTSGSCSPRFGYPQSFFSQLSAVNGSSLNILRNLSKAVAILAPVSAGLSFIALLFALGTALPLGIIASLMALIALLSTIVLLGLALGLFITARRRINRIPNSDAHLASCIWLVVAAAGCQLIAAFTVCFTRSRRRRANRDQEFAAVPAMQAHPMPVRESVSTEPAPSVVNSTGPLMHEAGAPVTGAPVGPTTTSATNGHFWQRNNTERY